MYHFYVKLNTVIVMTFKEDFKPSRVYNKLVIDAINKDFANAIVTLEKLNIIRRTDKRSMFEVNPRVIFKGDINKFHEIITKGKLDDSKIKLDNNVNYIDRIGLVKDDNCIIIKNKQVYKSELDYLYDDNENNVDKANNENNETEIIEAEEVDTGKIDWDW